MSARRPLGRVLILLALAAATWSAVTAISGGFELAALHVTSRDPYRPLLLAALLLIAARAALPSAEFQAVLMRTAGIGRGRLPARIALTASLVALVFAIAWNTRAAGGSDSSCYVLQAQAFAGGRSALEPPLREAAPGLSPLALAPIGFVPAPAPPHHAVPICAPGLALVMVPAVLAGRDAVFFVVPVFAALAVWCTFLLGRAVDDDVTGACGAVLMACSPIFLYQSVQPMSDVPAAALWLAALVLLGPSTGSSADDGSRGRQIVAGVCASAAVLMRPNVALIVLPLLVLLPGVRGWLRFGAASLPLLAVMAALNTARYGSPISSGYGDTGVLFSLAHVAPNLARYPRWLAETHTPLIALAAAAPFIRARDSRQRRFVLVAAAAVALTLATYLAYTVFDDWWYIRFLLPAIPVLLVFAVTVVRSAVAWRAPVTRVGRGAVLLIAALCAVAAGWFLHAARERSVFDLARLEARFRITGEYAGRTLPPNAIVLAVQQSGSIRYYGGRGTLAWDAVPAGALSSTIAWLSSHGYAPYIALEDVEEAPFRSRFGSELTGRLDWPPLAEVHAPVRVRIFDPSARARFGTGALVETEHVWK